MKSTHLVYIIFLFNLMVITVMSSQTARAAACCGGGFAVPSLITGDDQAQLTASLSEARQVKDVFANGNWADRSNPENVQTLKLDGAHIISDRWQVGAGLPILRRERQTSASQDQSSGLGDLSASIGYEFLPEWDYSVWKPKGIGFLQVIAPTGVSPEEQTDTAGLDVRGRGVWSVGLGSVLTKIVYPWNIPFDVSISAEGHRSFDRTIYSPAAQSNVTLHPGWGGSLSVGGGWSHKDLRLGAGLSWNYEDAIYQTGPVDQTGALERYATGVVQVAYLVKDDWSVSGSYSDQTLFGIPNNAVLSRSVLVSLQKRWPR